MSGDITNVYDPLYDKIVYQGRHDTVFGTTRIVTRIGATDFNPANVTAATTTGVSSSGGLQTANNSYSIAAQAYQVRGTPTALITDPQNSDWTLEQFFRSTGASSEGVIIALEENRAGTDHGQVFLTWMPDNRVKLWMRIGVGLFNANTSAGTFSTLTYHHLAIEKYAGKLYAYVDGARACTIDLTFGDIFTHNDEPWCVYHGARPVYGVSAGGYHDEVRLTYGTARYGGAFTFTAPSAAPLIDPAGPAFADFTQVAAIAQIQAYMAQALTLPPFVNDGLVNGLFALVVGAQTLPAFGQVALVAEQGTLAVATPPVGDSSYGLVQLLLRGESAGSFVDSGPFGVVDPITQVSSNVANNTSPAAPKFGGAMEFSLLAPVLPSVVSAFFNTDTAGLRSFGAADFTHECFFRSDTPVLGTIAYGGTSGNGVALRIEAYGPEHRVVSARLDTSGSDYVITGTPFDGGLIRLNEWQHLAVTCTGTTLRLFVDGALVGALTVVPEPTSFQADWVATFDALLPGYSFGTGGKAWIDDARVTVGLSRYTAAFTAPIYEAPTVYGRSPIQFTQAATVLHTDNNVVTPLGEPFIESVVSLMHGPALTNVIPNGHLANGNLISAAQIETGSLNASVIKCNGYTESHVRIIERGGNGAFETDVGTVEMRVKFERIYLDTVGANDEEAAAIFRTSQVNAVGVPDDFVDIYLHTPTGFAADGVFGINAKRYPTTVGSLVAYGALGRQHPQLETWYHLALVQNGTSLKLYVDGKLDVSLTLPAGFKALSVNGTLGDVRHDGGYAYNDIFSRFYVEEWRCTLGVARYTDVFPVPTAVFPDGPDTVMDPFTQVATVEALEVGVYGNQLLPDFPLYPGFVIVDVLNTLSAAHTFGDFTNETLIGAQARLVDGTQTLANFAQAAAASIVRKAQASSRLAGFAQVATATRTAAAAAAQALPPFGQTATVSQFTLGVVGAQTLPSLGQAAAAELINRLAGAQVLAEVVSAGALGTGRSVAGAQIIEDFSNAGLMEGAFVPPLRGYVVPPELRVLTIIAGDPYG